MVLLLLFGGVKPCHEFVVVAFSMGVPNQVWAVVVVFSWGVVTFGLGDLLSLCFCSHGFFIVVPPVISQRDPNYERNQKALT